MDSRWRPLAGVSRKTLPRELGAGVTLLAISIPLNIGYAQIAGLPASAGLYALILPSILFALLGSSRQLVVAPDAAAAALVASSLVGLAVVGSENYVAMAAAQAILGGAMLLLAGWLKLGFLASFLSAPILVGFVGGLALEITVSQVAKMLGVKIDSGAEFVEKLVELITGLGTIHVWSLVLGGLSLAILILGRRHLPNVPWALIVMVGATAVTALAGLQNRGVDVLGEVEGGLPVVSLPRLDLATWLALVQSAFALTAITIAEGLMMARKYSELRGYPTEPNRDLMAMGAANLGAGVTGGFTVGSSTSRTAAMDDAGSRTQIPMLVLAAGALALLAFGTALLADIPSPAIGAIVAFAVFRLLGFAEIREIFARSRAEGLVASACFAGVLILGPLRGLIVAFLLALINMARQASTPRVEVLADPGDPASSLLDVADGASQTAPGVLVLRLAAPIFFANASATTARVAELIAEAPHPVQTIVCDFEGVTSIDVTGGKALESMHEDLRRRGIVLAASRLRPGLNRDLTRWGLLEGVHVYDTNREALAAVTLDDGPDASS